jgi:hypothetical protein
MRPSATWPPLSPAACLGPPRGSGHGGRRAGGTRAPIRAALIRFWVKQRLLRVPVPLTGPRALSAEAPERDPDWVAAFLEAVAAEAADHLELLRRLEHGWLAARSKIVSRRSTSRAALAWDVLAAAPLMSATTLARAIGVSIKSATELLDRIVAKGAAVEVTHRWARRLFGSAPLRDVVQPPVRPDPSRRPGRSRHETIDDNTAAEVPSLPPVSPIVRPALDYSALEEAMAHLDAAVRRARVSLSCLTPNADRPAPASSDAPSRGGAPCR